MQVLLVHSPLLAKSSWGSVPAFLAGRGHTVAVPDLRPALESGPPFYKRLFRAIAAHADADQAVTVVGHSRAGPLLPGALATMGVRRATAVFLDARLPHEGLTWLETLTADRRDALLASVHNGRLAPWHRWFPEGAMTELIPDPVMRQRFRDETPHLPVTLLTEPMPPSTLDDRVGRVYVQLSGAYAETADQAEDAGWTVVRYQMDHLAPLTRSREVADVISSASSSGSLSAR